MKRFFFFCFFVGLIFLLGTLSVSAQDSPPADDSPVVTETPLPPDTQPSDSGWWTLVSSFSLTQAVWIAVLGFLCIIVVVGDRGKTQLAEKLHDAAPPWLVEEYIKPAIKRGLDTLDVATDIPGTTLDDDLRKYIRDEITKALDAAAPPSTPQPRL